jgi:signal transduction histidine kinase
MNQPRTFLDEAFHALAQPVMALRATVELGLAEEPGKLDSAQILVDCLRLIDKLTRDLALVREIASIERPPTLEASDGAALLRSCAEEMAPVARERGVSIHVDADAAAMECDPGKFRRAMFVLLDGLLAVVPDEGEIRLTLREDESGLRLAVFPAALGALRQKLCWKLMQSAGGTVTGCAEPDATILFPKAAGRQLPVTPLAHKQFLTSF